ncbi:MAG: hypothetical protein RLW87_08940 [Alphaproteobacteria bacterium]
MSILARSLSIVLGTLAGLIVVEITLASFLYFTEGEWVWTRDTEEMPHYAEPENPYRESTSVFHPFFGYVARPSINLGSPHEISQDGFFNPGQTLPVESDPNRFDLAILGGSVAAGLGVVERSKRIISKRLEELPELNGKSVNLINLAQGGYQFPTPLMILSYYQTIGQNFDAIILVDGFNESWNLSNPEKLIIPGWWERLARYFNSDIDRAFFEKWREILLSQSEKSNLAILSIILKATSKNIPELEENNIKFYYTLPNELKIRLDENHLADSWMRQIININKIKGDNTTFSHFLQPSHHIYTPIGMTEGKYTKTIRENYKYLTKRQSELKSLNIQSYSMLSVFGDSFEEQKTYYQDDCCHPTLVGYDILLNFMAEKLANQIKAKKP